MLAEERIQKSFARKCATYIGTATAFPLYPRWRTSAITGSMSVLCRFCCKSQLRQAVKRDSVVLTRFSVGSIHDGPSEE